MSYVSDTTVAIQKLWAKAAAIAAWQPLTTRGALAIVLSALLVKFYALPSSDLIAAVLGAAFIAIVLLVAGVALLLRIRIARAISAELRFELHEPISKTNIPAGIILKNSSVLSYFSLAVKRRFDQKGARSPSHVLKGREPELGKRHLIDSVWLPHRGLWTVSGIEFDLRDSLGFTRYRWLLPLQSGLEVSAPTLRVRPLPVLAASSQSGDHLHHTEERSGDLFDIKAYDPSDGIKKILWKTYARSRELVVRRPEPAVVPEGEVAVFLVADRNDDHVAGALQGYLEQLVENNIAILFGTDGVPREAGASTTNEMPAVPVAHYCTSLEDISRAINRSAWSKEAGTACGFPEFLASLANDNKRAHRVIVFADASDGSSTTGIAPNAWFQEITKAAVNYSTQLTIALVPPELGVRSFDAPIADAETSAFELLGTTYTSVVNHSLKRFGRESKTVTSAPLVGVSQSNADLLLVEGFE